MPRISNRAVHLVASVYMFFFSEWLFFVTKDSFFATCTLLSGIEAFFVSALFFLAAAGAATVVLSHVGAGSAAVVPAIITAVVAVLAADNFTYTLFRVGIISLHGLALIPALGLVVFLVCVFREYFARRELLPTSSLGACVAFSLVCGSVGCAALRIVTVSEPPPLKAMESPARRPNIVFFAGDGIDAGNMSVYGYARKTTPVLEGMRDRALIVNAALTNSGKTTSSLVSLLNGMLPTTTKVVAQNDVLRGIYSDLHLPGLLRRHGYRSFQETLDVYADSQSVNMRRAFDVVNGVAVSSLSDRLPLLSGYRFELELLFVRSVLRRTADRVLHLCGLRRMVNPIAAVDGTPKAKRRGPSDDERMSRVLELVRHEQEPFFLHLHLMGTHCCHFEPDVRVFSDGHTPSNTVDSYDDEVLAFDRRFATLVQALEERGILNNTLIVVSSDHGIEWKVDRRVPLIFFFPGGEHRGVLNFTAQLADVVPTVLDYLGVSVDWGVDGRSLLETPAPPTDRLIFTLPNGPLGTPAVRFYDASGTPLPELRDLALTVCDRQYTLTLSDGSMREQPLPGLQACAEERNPGLSGAKERILSHLKDKGWTPSPLH